MLALQWISARLVLGGITRPRFGQQYPCYQSEQPCSMLTFTLLCFTLPGFLTAVCSSPHADVHLYSWATEAVNVVLCWEQCQVTGRLTLTKVLLT